MALLRVALAVLRPVFGGARLVLGLTFAVLRTNIVFFTGTAVGGALAKRGAARKTEAMWRAEALAEFAAASPATIRRLLGSPLPWMQYPEWQRADWLNTVVAAIWPSANKAVSDIVLAKVAEITSKLSIPAVQKIELQHLNLGPPPKFAGFKAYAADGMDGVILEVDLRIRGAEPNAVVAITLVGGVTCLVQLAALQLSAVARLQLGPLVGAVPCVSALCVSLVGDPFLDFSLTALQGDLTAVPGLTGLVSTVVRKALADFTHPQRLVVPLIPEAGGYPGLRARARGLLLLRVARARGLPGLGPRQTLSPFLKARLIGGATEAVSKAKKGTRNPEWDWTLSLPCMDPTAQSLELELWDQALIASDELVSTTVFRLGSTLGAPDSTSPGVFEGWLPLEPYSPATLMSGSGLISGAGNLVGSGASLVGGAVGSVGSAMGGAAKSFAASAASITPKRTASDAAGAAAAAAAVAAADASVAAASAGGPGGGGGAASGTATSLGKGGEVYVQLAYVPFAPLTDAAADAALAAAAAGKTAKKQPKQKGAAAAAHARPPTPPPPPPPPPALPPGLSAPAAASYLAVRLLRCEGLVPPPRFGRLTPVVTFRLGTSVKESRPVPGPSPAYEQLFEFANVDPARTPLLRLDVAGGPPHGGALAGAANAAVGGVVSGVGSVLGAAASVATLGSVSLGPPQGAAADLQLRGVQGGVTRRPEADGDAALAARGVAAGGDPAGAAPPRLAPASFCGRASLGLDRVRARCAIEGGPYLEAIPLEDVTGGTVFLLVELRTLAPVAGPPAVPLAAPPAELLLGPDSGGGGAPSRPASPPPLLPSGSRAAGLLVTEEMAARPAEEMAARREEERRDEEAARRACGCF